MEVTFDGGKVITAHLNGHVIRTDQPVMGGGTNSAPSPFELFLASIGACAGIYVKGFCDQRGIPSNNIKIVQSVEYERATGLPTDIKIDIQLPADFPEIYKEAVIKVADLCKVKKTITNPPSFSVIASSH